MTVSEARSEFLDFVKTLVSTCSYTLADILSNDFSTVVSVVGAKIISNDGSADEPKQEKVLSLWEFGQSLK